MSDGVSVDVVGSADSEANLLFSGAVTRSYNSILSNSSVGGVAYFGRVTGAQ